MQSSESAAQGQLRSRPRPHRPGWCATAPRNHRPRPVRSRPSAGVFAGEVMLVPAAEGWPASYPRVLVAVVAQVAQPKCGSAPAPFVHSLLSTLRASVRSAQHP